VPPIGQGAGTRCLPNSVPDLSFGSFSILRSLPDHCSYFLMFSLRKFVSAELEIEYLIRSGNIAQGERRLLTPPFIPCYV
jgi:hypothetical protein